MYCVNGQAPYFKTLQEARRHALVSKDLWLDELRENGLYKAVADIYDDNGGMVGSLICAPDPILALKSKTGIGFGFYYLKEGTTRIQFMNACDGGLAPDVVDLDFKAQNNKYRIPFKDGDLPFTDIDEARAFLYKVFNDSETQMGSGCPILNLDGEILGFVLKHDPETIIYGSCRKWKEVKPNGRLGKAVKARYASTATALDTKKVYWDKPMLISKDSKEAL